MKAHLSLAAFPGVNHLDAVELAQASAITEPWFGEVCWDHVQLVPQCRGRVTSEMALQLAELLPDTIWRLHANVHVGQRRQIADLSNWSAHAAYFDEVAHISRLLRAPAYSAHAGRRANSTCARVIEVARSASELFQCPVAIEGHYPTKAGDVWLFSSWEEYRLLFESGVPYALDLSHLNIVSRFTGRQEFSLLSEMLNCDRCLEIHVSDNDGTSDQHLVLSDTEPWWFTSLKYAHQSAIIFSEGNRLMKRSTLC